MKTEQKHQFYCDRAESDSRGRRLCWTRIPQESEFPHLGRRMQTVLRVSAGRVIGEQGEPGELRPPGADPLGQREEELLHRGGAVETHHLRDKRGNFRGGTADGA